MTTDTMAMQSGIGVRSERYQSDV